MHGIIRKESEFQLQENAPHQVNKGGVIATGVNAELDELRNISSNGKETVAPNATTEIEATESLFENRIQ